MCDWMPSADMTHLASISFQFLGQICYDMGQEPYVIHLCVCADANRASPEGDMPELCTHRIATHTQHRSDHVANAAADGIAVAAARLQLVITDM